MPEFSYSILELIKKCINWRGTSATIRYLVLFTCFICCINYGRMDSNPDDSYQQIPQTVQTLMDKESFDLAQAQLNILFAGNFNTQSDLILEDLSKRIKQKKQQQILGTLAMLDTMIFYTNILENNYQSGDGEQYVKQFYELEYFYQTAMQESSNCSPLIANKADLLLTTLEGFNEIIAKEYEEAFRNELVDLITLRDQNSLVINKDTLVIDLIKDYESATAVQNYHEKLRSMIFGRLAYHQVIYRVYDKQHEEIYSDKTIKKDYTFENTSKQQLKAYLFKNAGCELEREGSGS